MTIAAPLDGITILDASRVLSGPYCTMLAADMGARVIKIEHPVRGDDTRAWGPPFLEGESAYYLSINRNKESVAIDFKKPEGRALLHSLVAKADVFVENFRPGTLDPIGLGWSEVSTRHPKLIYVSISGFGQHGPRRNEAGYDAVAQGESGLMSITGEPSGPPLRHGVAIADLAAGLFAFQGLLLALIARGKTGTGQLVDISLLDSATTLLSYHAARYFATGESPVRSGNRHLSIAPYETFDAADGVLVLAVGTDQQWATCRRVLDLGDAAADPKFDTNRGRVVHYAELRPIVAGAIRARPLASLVAALRDASVPCGAVRSVEEALADPQVLERAMVETVSHPTIGPLKMLGMPVKLSATPGAVRSAPPRLGEHTASVLRSDLGLDDDAIARLAASGAIGLAPR